MVFGTLLGTVSSLYDKYLLGTLKFTPGTVQAWFSIYLVVVFLPVAIGWKRRWWPRNEFHWRWTILFIGLFLLVSDFAYFTALHDPQGLVSVVASIRRGSTLVRRTTLWKVFRVKVSGPEFPLTPGNPEFWFVAITLSLIAGLFYPLITSWFGRGRNYFLGYGIEDVIYVWCGSIVVGSFTFLLVLTALKCVQAVQVAVKPEFLFRA